MPEQSNTDLCFMPATELVARYAAKTLSPVEVTRAVLDRIRALNPKLNAYCLLDEEGALAAARASESRWMAGEPAGPVDGVPGVDQGSRARQGLADFARLEDGRPGRAVER